MLKAIVEAQTDSYLVMNSNANLFIAAAEIITPSCES